MIHGFSFHCHASATNDISGLTKLPGKMFEQVYCAHYKLYYLGITVINNNVWEHIPSGNKANNISPSESSDEVCRWLLSKSGAERWGSR